MQDYQKQYDSINKEIKTLIEQKEQIIKQVEEQGFMFDNDKLIENKKVYGAFYDMDFYSHFDGHISEAVYYQQAGADEITKEKFETLKLLIDAFKYVSTHDDHISTNEAINNLEKDLHNLQIVPCNWFNDNIYDIFSFFTIEDENTINWKYVGNSDDSELVDGSTLKICLTTEKEIKSAITIYNY